MGRVGVDRMTEACRAVLLDGLGTLLRLEPPAPALRRQLAGRLGLEVSAAEARRAIEAEIAYYRAHHWQGRDRASLAALRRRCAGVLRDALGPDAAGVPIEEMTGVLLAALRFRAFPDAVPALRALRARGVRLVVVSNWDVSLHDALADTGLARLVHGAISSAELGAAKPDPAIFRHALTLAGVPAEHALHVGDSLELDVFGALAAGIPAALISRRDGVPVPEGVLALRSLRELVAHVG
jgi:putative hydrolase of the HAD superfamily